MSRITIFLARLIGLFTIAVVIALVIRGVSIVEVAIANEPLLFMLGLISLGLGIAMVLAHNVWSGGALPVVVTVVGWLILAKGMLLTIVPSAMFTQLLDRMNWGENMNFFLIPAALIACYLTWAGFSPRYDATLN
jgi:hypothetical protein